MIVHKINDQVENDELFTDHHEACNSYRNPKLDIDSLKVRSFDRHLTATEKTPKISKSSKQAYSIAYQESFAQEIINVILVVLNESKMSLRFFLICNQ